MTSKLQKMRKLTEVDNDSLTADKKVKKLSKSYFNLKHKEIKKKITQSG